MVACGDAVGVRGLVLSYACGGAAASGGCGIGRVAMMLYVLWCSGWHAHVCWP